MYGMSERQRYICLLHARSREAEAEKHTFMFQGQGKFAGMNDTPWLYKTILMKKHYQSGKEGQKWLKWGSWEYVAKKTTVNEFEMPHNKELEQEDSGWQME